MCEGCDKQLAKWRGWNDVPLPTEVGRGPWTDMSYVIDRDVPGGPLNMPVRIDRITSMPKDPYNQTIIEMVAHQGTHIDAPLHYIEDGPSVDQIPLERLYGPAVVWHIDASPLQVIEPADLERMRPKMRPGDMVIFSTGWPDRLGTPDFFRNPSLSAEAAEWLARQGAKAIAVDFRSPELPHEARWQGWHWPVHHILLSQGILIAECLRNTRALAGHRVEAAFLGLNIRGSDGSPARVLARRID